jgi:8-oxo-dGTP diphosphatase
VGAVVLRAGCGAQLRGGGEAASTEVLLVQRAREPMAGTWSLPGGAIELGETAAEACAREVREETGIEVDVLETVETVDIILRDDAGKVRFHYLVVDMLCRATGGSLLAGGDASRAVWAKMEEALGQGSSGESYSLTPRACTVIRKAVERFGNLR